jgi:hypothetical protein
MREGTGRGVNSLAARRVDKTDVGPAGSDQRSAEVLEGLLSCYGRTYAGLVSRTHALGTVRDAGPTVLVPLAWLVVAGAHRGVVGEDAVFVAHLVMAAFIAAFAVTGWSQMATGALRGWRAVLVVGLAVTIAGIGGFVLSSRELLAISIVGWMALPAVGLAYTGYLFESARAVYYTSAALSGLGAVAYVISMGGAASGVSLLGLALVGIGQTVGIVDAAVRGE